MDCFVEGIRTAMPDDIFGPMYLDPARTAVMTLDMHKGHLDIEDPKCPAPSPRGLEIIEPINEFTSECRELGIPVIHVRSVLRKDGADDIKGNISAWRVLRMLRSPAPENDTSEHALEGSKWTEFCVRVEDSDYIVDGKKRLSAWYPSDLELLLRNLHKDILVVTGAMTDCCVLSTVSEGANHDFRMVIPKDLVRGYGPLEESALSIISRYFGIVVDSKELLNEWEKK